MDKPVRIASVIILVVVIAGAVASNWELLVENFARLALITIVFCLISLTVGYFVPRWLRVGKRQAIATSFEIGIHNATLAIVIAQTVLGTVELSLPGRRLRRADVLHRVRLRVPHPRSRRRMSQEAAATDDTAEPETEAIARRRREGVWHAHPHSRLPRAR